MGWGGVGDLRGWIQVYIGLICAIGHGGNLRLRELLLYHVEMYFSVFHHPEDFPTHPFRKVQHILLARSF